MSHTQLIEKTQALRKMGEGKRVCFLHTSGFELELHHSKQIILLLIFFQNICVAFNAFQGNVPQLKPLYRVS